MSRPIDRRRFIQRTTSATAALSSWSVLSAARGADRPGAKLVVGVMGTNGRGTALASEFAELAGAEVAYVCDVDRRAIDKATSAVVKQGAKSPVGVVDFRSILDDDSVDALVIAAPDHWHAPAAILACAAGKHVYVEKPTSHNPREGELMVEAARKHDRVVQVGTQRRSSPGIRQAIERVRAGQVGPVRFVRGWINSTRPNIGYGKPATVPEWLDFAQWQGPAPERPYHDNIVHYNWHWFWHWGTGELGNNGIHALDVCRWGAEVDYPTTVTCNGGKLFFDDDQETPDTQIATYRFDDGKVINWEHRTWHRRGFEGQNFGIQFYGDGGSLIVTQKDYTIYDMDGRELERVAIHRGEMEHLENFLSAIRSGTALNAEIEEGVKSTLLCHLGNIAYRTGRTVNLDRATRRIDGDAEQEGLWSREYRSGLEPTV